MAYYISYIDIHDHGFPQKVFWDGKSSMFQYILQL